MLVIDVVLMFLILNKNRAFLGCLIKLFEFNTYNLIDHTCMVQLYTTCVVNNVILTLLSHLKNATNVHLIYNRILPDTLSYTGCKKICLKLLLIHPAYPTNFQILIKYI